MVVLAAAGGLARLWVMQQYYVGLDGNQVTIFQGVRGQVLGVPLHEVVEHTDSPSTAHRDRPQRRR